MSWVSQLRKPILKSKPILKGKPVKKNMFTYTSPDGTISRLDQDVGVIHTKIKKDFTTWENKCSGLSGNKIGVTGGKGYTDSNKPPDKQFENTLLGHLENHVTSTHARKGKGERSLFKDNLSNFKKIIGGGESPEVITEEQIEEMRLFKEDLLELWEGDKNPRNIWFTIPSGVKKVKGKGGKEKWAMSGETKVYGHYRTPDYVKYREKVRGKKELPAVDSSWYSIGKEGKDTAKPPMYQAIFSGSTKDKTSSDLVGGKGLLGIVEEFYDQLDGIKVKTLQVDRITARGTKQVKEDKVNLLLKFPPFVAEIEKMMKLPIYFKQGGNKNYLNTMRFREALIKIPLDVSGMKQADLMASFADIKDIQGTEHLETVVIDITSAMINMAINRIVRAKGGKALLAPNSKFPFILSSAGGGRKYEGQTWSADFKSLMEAAKPKKEVKKSWVEHLWR